jgi:hypothetical protein
LGAVIDEQFLNYGNWSETLRADYALSPDTAMFVSGTHNNDVYFSKPPVVPYDRDSNGYEVIGGVNFQVSHLILGDIGVGYLEQDFPDIHLPDQNTAGFAVHGDLHWYPADLATVDLQANRYVLESAVAGAASYVNTTGTAQLDYEVRHNIVVTLLGRYTTNAYQGIDRQDDIWTVGLSGTYLISRALSLTLAYGHDNQVSTGAARGFGYSVDRVLLTLTVQR